MENIRNRMDVRLVTCDKVAIKLAAKPNYDHCTIFDENLVAIHMRKIKLKFDKPVYLGMCILDLSKTLMYDFHYNYIKSKYGNKSKMLYTDTDSLIYLIETNDFYKDISPDIQSKFDTSDYPSDHPLAGVNKKVLGMFKDEACGRQIAEFVGLRAKLYSYRMHTVRPTGDLSTEGCVGKEHKKCKGIKKKIVENNITFDDYKKCLRSRKPQSRTMNVIRSRGHEIYTETLNKVALSADDDKRIIRDDGIHTLAYGHYLLN
jgi:hypothetical protein